MKTPYDVLGISLDADEKTIAIAFREAAKHCHPDLNPGHHASKRFKEISGARRHGEPFTSMCSSGASKTGANGSLLLPAASSPPL
jgi:hypothetical protein